MPLLEILSEKKRLEYDRPPVFTAQERKYFFGLPSTLKNKVHSYPTVTNKVGFRLMFGYFLATKQFFPSESFHERDVQYLCNQYGMMPFAFDRQKYKRSTYTRHRQLILTHFAFEAYQPNIHLVQVEQAIKEQVYSWESPKLIFTYLLEWLENRRIELPTYHQLQQIITNSIRLRDQQTKQKFSALLQQEHKLILDTLLEKHNETGQEMYRFIWLQQLSPSDSPSQIKVNTDKLSMVQSIYKTMQPVLDTLALNGNAIRHFGELVRHTKSSHLLRKHSLDRYFHLTLFCAYQRCVFEDWMTQTFVSVCKSATHKAIGKEKQRLFEHRNQRRADFQQVMNLAEDASEVLEQVRQIAWRDIPAKQKEYQLQQLLPEQSSASQDQPSTNQS